MPCSLPYHIRGLHWLLVRVFCSFTAAASSLLISDSATAQNSSTRLSLCRCTLKSRIIDSSAVYRISFKRSLTNLQTLLSVEDWSQLIPERGLDTEMPLPSLPLLATFAI